MLDAVIDSAPQAKVKGRSFEEVIPELDAALSRFYNKFPQETVDYACMWVSKYNMGLVHPHVVVNLLKNDDPEVRQFVASRLRMADPAAQALVNVLLQQFEPEIHKVVFGTPVAQAEEAVATVSEVSTDA